MMTSRYAIPALAAVLAGGLSFSPAQAADLGGDCCADLEERVAELEATTVRKGNRKVSVKISGFVSKSVMFWDDGDESNVYVVDTNGGTLSSNFSISGTATIRQGWSAGYNIVVEVPGGGNATAVNQNNDNAGGGIDVLVSSLHIKSDKYGKISIGKQSQASDNTALLPDLSGTIIQSNYVQFHGLSFLLRDSRGGLTGATWTLGQSCNTTPTAGIAMDCNGLVLNNVRYDSPTIAGFTLSTSWGEDDFWDVALNYAGTWGDVKVKAGAAYTNMTDAITGPTEDAHFFQVGASILHVPTGLFVYGAYIHDEEDEISERPDVTGWYIKAGIRRKWNSHGETIIYGEYKNVEDGFAGFEVTNHCAVDGVFDGASFDNAGGCFVEGTDVDIYGVGVVQYIDAAAMQLHFKWQHSEIDVNLVDAAGDKLDADFEDLDIFLVGATIFF